MLAFRISYVGEQGWELHFKYEDGLALWDALHALGVTPVGVETYANSRRMEKSLRLQNADRLTECNLYECDLARPKVKAAALTPAASPSAQASARTLPSPGCRMRTAKWGASCRSSALRMCIR